MFARIPTNLANMATPPKSEKSGQRVVVGEVGARVGENVASLRGRMSFRELAERLNEQGRPIDGPGVFKIEHGFRRVDVEDLLALAVALGCSPNRLLLSAEADDEPVTLTSATTTTRRDAWRWATGEAPLPPRNLDFDHAFAFERENAPHKSTHMTPPTQENLERLGAALVPVVEAMAAVEAEGQVTVDEMIEYLGLWNFVRRLEAKPKSTAATRTTTKRTTSKRER